MEEDHRYIDSKATSYDLAWQAIHKGYIGNTKTIDEVIPLPIEDEYHFIRKYFNSAWVLYVLIIRILSLNNPIKEISAWLNTNKTSRSNYLKKPIEYPGWTTFNSQLLLKNPRVSIIIPTLNRYPYLKDGLLDLEKQEYTNFEVIIVDQSNPYQEEFYNTFNLELKVMYQKEKALWLARNSAIKDSKCDLLLFLMTIVGLIPIG